MDFAGLLYILMAFFEIITIISLIIGLLVYILQPSKFRRIRKGIFAVSLVSFPVSMMFMVAGYAVDNGHNAISLALHALVIILCVYSFIPNKDRTYRIRFISASIVGVLYVISMVWDIVFSCLSVLTVSSCLLLFYVAWLKTVIKGERLCNLNGWFSLAMHIISYIVFYINAENNSESSLDTVIFFLILLFWLPLDIVKNIRLLKKMNSPESDKLIDENKDIEATDVHDFVD